MQPPKVMLKIWICQTMRKHPFDHSIRKFPSISKQTNLLETKTIPFAKTELTMSLRKHETFG